MQILKKLLIFSFALFSLETFASLGSDLESRNIAISSFNKSLTTLKQKNVSEKDFLERFKLALNNVIPDKDKSETVIPNEAQKFKASFESIIDLIYIKG